MSPVEELQVQTEALAGDAQREVMAIYARWRAGEIAFDDAVALIAAVLNRVNATAATLAEVYLVAQIEELAGVPVLSTGTLPVDDSARLLKAVHTVLTEPPKTKLKPAEVRDLIRSADLDPKDWDVPAVRKRVNTYIRDQLPDADGEGGFGEPLDAGTFIEWVEESPAHEGAPMLNSDDYTHLPPVWEAEPDNAEMRLTRLSRAEPFKAAQTAVHAAMQEQTLVEGWTRQMDADPCQLCRWWSRNGRVWPKQHPFQSHTGCNCQPKIVLVERISSTYKSRQLERAAS